MNDLQEAIEARDLPAALVALEAALAITWDGLSVELGTNTNTLARWRRGRRYLSPGPWIRVEALARLVELAGAGDQEAEVALRALRDAWPDGRGRTRKAETKASE